MARGINKVILVGNLGADPETRYMPSGSAVTNLSVATSESWKDKQSDEWKEKTEWHRVVVWGNQADKARSWSKGQKVSVEGQIQTRKWTDKEGVDRYTTEINARRVTLLSPKNQEAANEAPPPPATADELPDVPF